MGKCYLCIGSGIELTDLSVTGSTGLTYNDTTGTFTYTAPTVTASDLNSISIDALSDVTSTELQLVMFLNGTEANGLLKPITSVLVVVVDPLCQMETKVTLRCQTVVPWTIDNTTITTAAGTDDAVTAAKLADTSVTAGSYQPILQLTLKANYRRC